MAIEMSPSKNERIRLNLDVDKKNTITCSYSYDRVVTKADIPGGGVQITMGSRSEYVTAKAGVVDNHYALFWSCRVLDGSTWGAGSEKDHEWDSLDNFFCINELDQPERVKGRLKDKVLELVRQHSKYKGNISERVRAL